MTSAGLRGAFLSHDKNALATGDTAESRTETGIGYEPLLYTGLFFLFCPPIERFIINLQKPNPKIPNNLKSKNTYSSNAYQLVGLLSNRFKIKQKLRCKLKYACKSRP